ncbi:HNH endonuclease [Apilactobacillus micheneri]|uniref:HNH endonuclease n=1 Tax=Apilactobacillus micheneri TaxID=1899430 RepID=UPI0011279391|nr:HNH endonuclease [Apilactobacillus micheneri]TPR49844.1 hypothetical protein DY126_07495 [Apilactobacillus micheneri]
MIQHYCDSCQRILVNYNEKFCTKCKTKVNKNKANKIDKEYITLIKSSKWRKLSEQVRCEQPMCSICLKKKKLGQQIEVRPSEEVHHILKVRDYPDSALDRKNLIGLCKKCHKVLTDKGF